MINRCHNGDAIPSGNPEESRDPAEIMRHARILVVEDNAVNQQLAVLFLEHMGSRVEVVENGLQAIEAVARESYDVILMDCQMPEMDGYEATREIRKWEAENRDPLPENRELNFISEENLKAGDVRDDGLRNTGRRIPIIAMTAHAVQGDQERCAAAGMDDYISKPIRVEELQQVLHKWVVARTRDEPTAPPPSSSVPSHIAHPCLTREEPGFSIDRLNQLREMGGPALLSKVIGHFIQDVQVIVQDIQTSISAGDATSLNKAAHGLKGICLNLGAETLAALALELEQQGSGGDLSRSKQCADQFRDEFQRVQQYLGRMSIASY